MTWIWLVPSRAGEAFSLGLMLIDCLYGHVCVRVCSVASVMPNSAVLWMGVHQALLSVGFSRHEYWSGLPCPPPGDLPNPGIGPAAPSLQIDSSPLRHWGGPSLWNLRLFL